MEAAASASPLTSTAASAGKVQLAAPDLAPSKAKYVLVDSQFAHGCLGGKSNNLQLLRKPDALALLGAGVSLPSSVALPFGAFERVLSLPANAAGILGLLALRALRALLVQKYKY